MAGAVENVQRDADREYRIHARPTQHRQSQRHDGGGVGQQIGGVVQRIGADRRGLRAADHVTLEQQQRAGGNNGEQQNANADQGIPDRLWV